MNSLPDDLGPRLRESVNHGTAPELSTDLVTGAADRTAPKLADPRRRLQFAGAATVLVAAVTVTALAIGGGLTRAPLFTAASSTQTGGATSASIPATNELMRIWAQYRYQAGAGLSTSGGNGEVYQLTRSGTGSEHASAIAAAFGLSGEEPEVDDSDPANPAWTVGSTDGTTPSLELTWSGTGDWWFSNPAESPAIACPPTEGTIDGSSGSSTGSSPSTPPSTTSPSTTGPVTGPACTSAVQPAAPGDAPTGSDARSRAQKIFAQTGLDVSTDDIQLNSDSYQTTATANLVVGGVTTALDWGVTWSDSGAVSSAYGHSVTVVDRGSYGTISASDAVERLSDSRWYGTAGPAYQGGIRPFAAAGVGRVASGTAEPLPSATPTGDPSPVPTVSPIGTPTGTPTDGPTTVPTATPTGIPTDAPTPEPTTTGPPIIEVTVTKAAPTLLLMSDSNGGAWLVPGYAMQIENGWWNSVVSLDPGVIQLPPTPTVEPDVVAPLVGTPRVTGGSTPAVP